MKTIAVIDDDIYIGDMLEALLTKEGYQVQRAYSGTEALLLLAGEKPNLVLLDLMLPGMNGEEVLEHIKEIPVIVISAKIGVEDKVNLLLGGAADYVTKPFEPKELLARIVAQLRKAEETYSEAQIRYDEIVLDIERHQVLAGEIQAHLTKTEFAILKLLMKNPEQVITKSQLLELISLETPDCVESSLKVHISNLRGKLRTLTEKDYIEAVWGIGFKMRKQ